MRAACVGVIVILLVAATAGAEDDDSARELVRLVAPVVPPSMDRDLRDTLEDAIAEALAVGPMPRVGGAARAPCGIVFRQRDREVARASLVWRAGRVVERVEWDLRDRERPTWRRTRSVLRDGRVVIEDSDSMQYRDGRADCPNGHRRVVARDARGRIVSVRSTSDTCEGVDAGTWRYRHVWRHRRGFEEAIVRSLHEGPAELSTRIFVPNEREAWASLGGGVFDTWLDVRDDEGFLRVRMESEGEVGEHVYACEGPAWPHGPRAPDTIEGLDAIAR